MDPNATLRDLLVSLLEGDRDGTIDAAENLAIWVDRGGFMPDVDSVILALPRAETV